jgi:DNA-binding response OmpR family regulator
VSRVVALVPDLMFGSKVKAMLEADGHAVELVSTPEAARDRIAGAATLVVDLATGDVDAAEAVAAARSGGTRVRTLGAYSHVDADSRRRAEEAGFDMVVPRSRMVREGAALVARLIAAG